MFQEASDTGMPMMRPMWVHYPNDANTFDMDDQVRLLSRPPFCRPTPAPVLFSCSVAVAAAAAAPVRDDVLIHVYLACLRLPSFY